MTLKPIRRSVLFVARLAFMEGRGLLVLLILNLLLHFHLLHLHLHLLHLRRWGPTLTPMLFSMPVTGERVEATLTLKHFVLLTQMIIDTM